MAQLNIALLGPFQVADNEGPITQFEADTARALLAYLAMQPATAFPRELLADLLWPDTSRSDALVALRQTLSRLRRAIGDNNASPAFLNVTRQSIEFNPQSDYWLDVTTFTQLVGAVQKHPHRHLETCRYCTQQLEQAANLYRGDFMSGFVLDSFPFEEWMLIEREHLHQQAMNTFYHLATYHNRHGSHQQAQYYARQQLALEPWCEEAHRQLMTALALNGQRSAALAQYKSACEILMEELGSEPTSETKQLLAQIHDGSLKQQAQPVQNLPALLTSFIGRKRDLAHITKQLENPDCRLLTLVGPGGVGKTRLALMVAGQMAPQFQHGVWFVPLVDITAPQVVAEHADRNVLHNQLATAIATALRFNFSGQEHPKQQLLRSLAAKDLLLVLDNFEHLTCTADFVIDLLKAAPGLSILVTSRARLNLQAEQVLQIMGLSVPKKGAPDAADYSSVQLFYKRGRNALVDFQLDDQTLPHVVRLCRMLKGLPLGIELAATWVGRLPLADIVANLQRDIDFLSTTHQDIPKRHRHLRAVFESSWQLLSKTEQRALAQLSVFRGNFSYAATQAIARINLADLASLVDKSLLHTGNSGRYIVHEMLRQFAAEKLATQNVSNESGMPDQDLVLEIQERHARYYLTLAAAQTAPLYGEEPQRAVSEVQLEMANLRQAWQWAVAHLTLHSQANTAGRTLPATLANCVESLMRFYDLKGLLHEGEEMFGVASNQIQTLLQSAASSSEFIIDAADASALTRLLAAQAHFLEAQGHYAAAMDILQQALSLLKQIEPPLNTEMKLNQMKLLKLSGDCYHKLSDYIPAELCYAQSLELAEELGNLAGQAQAHQGSGHLAWKQGDLDLVQLHYTQSLEIWRKTGDKKSIAESLNDAGQLTYLKGEYAKAQKYFEEALALRRQIGDQQGIADSLNKLGNIRCQKGDFTAALPYYTEVLKLRREIGDQRAIAASLNNLGLVACAQEDYQAACAYHQESLDITHSIGDRWGEAHSLSGLAFALARQDSQAARSAWEQSLAIRREIGDQRGVAKNLNSLGYLAYLQADYAAAQEYLEEGLALAREIQYEHAISDGLVGFVLTHFRQGHAEISRRYCYEMLAVSSKLGFDRDTYTALVILGLLYCQQGVYHKSAELLGVLQEHPPFIRPLIADDIQTLRSSLATALPPEELEAAMGRGKAMGLETTVAKLLADKTEETP